MTSVNAGGEKQNDGAAVATVQNVGCDERRENQAGQGEQVGEIEQESGY